MKSMNRNKFAPGIESLEDRQLLATGMMAGIHNIFGTGQLAVTRAGTEGPRVITTGDLTAPNGTRVPVVGPSPFLALAGLGLVAPGGNNGQVGAADAGLNDSVLAYAVAALGTQVDDGGCWALVDEALKAAGADTSGDFNNVFGAPVGLDTLIPGDVLQFEGVHFEGPDPVTGGWYWQDFPHHSAIVYAVNGSQITLLNQNINGDTTVQFTTINLADWQTGDIYAYRPQLP